MSKNNNEEALKVLKIIRKMDEAESEFQGIENLGCNLVYNPEILFKLRDEVGDTVGMNFDLSHLF